MDMGFITYDRRGRRYIPDEENQMSYGILAAVWHMRDRMHESISVGLAMADMIEHVSPLVANFSFQEKKSNAEKLEPLVFSMLLIMCLFTNRTPYDPTDPDSVKLSEIAYFNQAANREFLETWQERFDTIQNTRIPDRWAHCRDPIVPNTELDGRLLCCLLDRNYVQRVSFKAQQKLKQQIWQLGNPLYTPCNPLNTPYNPLYTLPFPR